MTETDTGKDATRTEEAVIRGNPASPFQHVVDLLGGKRNVPAQSTVFLESGAGSTAFTIAINVDGHDIPTCVAVAQGTDLGRGMDVVPWTRFEKSPNLALDLEERPTWAEWPGEWEPLLHLPGWKVTDLHKRLGPLARIWPSRPNQRVVEVKAGTVAALSPYQFHVEPARLDWVGEPSRVIISSRALDFLAGLVRTDPEGDVLCGTWRGGFMYVYQGIQVWSHYDSEPWPPHITAETATDHFRRVEVISVEHTNDLALRRVIRGLERQAVGDIERVDYLAVPFQRKALVAAATALRGMVQVHVPRRAAEPVMFTDEHGGVSVLRPLSVV